MISREEGDEDAGWKPPHNDTAGKTRSLDLLGFDGVVDRAPVCSPLEASSIRQTDWFSNQSSYAPLAIILSPRVDVFESVPVAE